MKIFSHEQKTARHWVFSEGYSQEFRFMIGVVVGDEKVLVIDAGMGMTGDLRRYIESVIGSDKPIICAVSQNMLDSDGTPFEWIEDGDVFDLGGVTLEVIALPGHSAGSLAYYDRAEDICYTGDGINHPAIQIHNLDFYYNTPEHRALMPAFMELPDDGTELTLGECYAKYAEVVRRLLAIIGDNATIYSGHCTMAQTVQTAKNIIAACEDLAAYRIEGDQPADSIFDYQKNTPQKYHRVHWSGNTGIVYDAAKFDREAAARAEQPA
jgi:glyoxylase-like metal-dependent hydrolase (beta-lactamase superfamily II)